MMLETANMSIVSEGMLIDAVDASDTPIGTIVRADVFKVHANFRVAHVLVFNSKGDLLIQRLAMDRRRHPGYWGSSVAAYLFSGEDYRTAATRRVSEELGIGDASLEFVGKLTMQDEGCTKFIGLFITSHDGPFRYDRQHVERVEFWPLWEIRQMIANGTRLFTPTFIDVLNSYDQAASSFRI